MSDIDFGKSFIQTAKLYLKSNFPNLSGVIFYLSFVLISDDACRHKY